VAGESSHLSADVEDGLTGCSYQHSARDIYVTSARQEPVKTVNGRKRLKVLRRSKQVVAQLMGDANVDTTLNVYSQVLDGSVRAAAEMVSSELFKVVHNRVIAAEGR
jgi:hypothetical protein